LYLTKAKDLTIEAKVKDLALEAKTTRALHIIPNPRPSKYVFKS